MSASQSVHSMFVARRDYRIAKRALMQAKSYLAEMVVEHSELSVAPKEFEYCIADGRCDQGPEEELQEERHAGGLIRKRGGD